MPNGVTPGEPGSPMPPPPPAGPPPGQGSGTGFKLPPIDPEALSKTPWVVGAVAILIALVIFWLSSIIGAFGSGLPARLRIIDFLGLGRDEWALAILLAVALLVLGSGAADKGSSLVLLLYQVLFIAAALVALASVVNAIIEFTYIGDTPDLALAGFVGYLAGVPIAGAAALWAFRSNPAALPRVK